MAPGIVRVLIATLFCFASAETYSRALKGPVLTERLPTRVASISSARGGAEILHRSIQEPPTSLQPGATHDQQISTGDVQSFTIELGAGQYAEVVFESFGINLGIAVLDPDGKKLLPNDPTVSNHGPLSISILADKVGTYRLNVKPTVAQKTRGKYQLRLGDAPHLPSDSDRSRLEAQSQLSRAQGAPPSLRIESYDKAIGFFNAAKDTNGAARALMLRGDAYREARDLLNPKARYELAKVSYQQAADIWNSSRYQRGEGYAKVSLGQLSRSNNPLEAVGYYKQAQLLFAQTGDVRGEADALYGESFALMILNQPIQALLVLEQTIRLRRADLDLNGEASAINMSADAYRMLGEADKSFELYNQLLGKIDGLDNRLLEAAIEGNKGLVYHNQGFWEQAKDQYTRALSIYESILGKTITIGCDAENASKSPACRAAALTFDNLGQVYTSLGQFETAFQELEKALSIWNALGDAEKVNKATTTLHIGYAKFSMDRPRDALVDYERALTLQKEANNAAGIALMNTYIGVAYEKLNEPIRAIENYNSALPVQRAAGDKRALAITLDNLGMAQHLTGNSKDALMNFSSALELWRGIRGADGEALTLYHRALVQAAMGDLAAANQGSENAIRLVESLRTSLRSGQSRTAYLAEMQDYYKLDIDLKMRLSKSGQGEAFEKAAFESSEMARARVLLDSLAEADVVRSISSKAASSHLVSLREQRDSVEKKLTAKAAARSTFLSRLNEKPAPEQIATIAAIDRDIAELSGRLDELEQAIKSADPRFASLVRPQPASFAQIQGQLDKDTLLLEYSMGDERSYVWAVTADSIEGFELAPRKEIEGVADKLSRALTERNRAVKNESDNAWRRRILQADIDHDAAATALSEMTLKSVGSLLGNKRLVIVADGVLQLISFAALPVPTTARRASDTTRELKGLPTPGQRSVLVDDHEIVYEPSASVFELHRRELQGRPSAPFAVAVLADPVFEKDDPRVKAAVARSNRQGEPKTPSSTLEKPTEVTAGRNSLTRALDDIGITRFPALPTSSTEARSIIKAAGPERSKVALNFEANRATAMSAELAKYRTIHFATHSVADFAHPDLSGIVLSMVDDKGQAQDGYLRLHDIYNLNLPADLVVLSACQTAVGKQIKGEGLIALTRGFMYAGAQRVVASLWKVDDAATAQLMAEFYDQMFKNGLKPAAALRAAQKRMAQLPSRRPPYYWAGFVLQGEWK